MKHLLEQIIRNGPGPMTDVLLNSLPHELLVYWLHLGPLTNDIADILAAKFSGGGKIYEVDRKLNRIMFRYVSKESNPTQFFLRAISAQDPHNP